ncbi:MAG: AbrB/MazE/SpoVT family DNA-binding domain-containing protein [Anaerolineae bacterium]
MASLVKVTRSGQITIPAAVRRAANIQEGDYVEVTVVDDKVVLTPKRLVDKSQAYFWTEEWQAAEREADEDIRAGRVRAFESAEELIADLDA